MLVVVLVLVGHLKRTGIGRMIVGVRENELAASAMTVSPARAKLIAFASAGSSPGSGCAPRRGEPHVRSGGRSSYFLVENSIRLVAIVVIGGLGSLSGAVVGALWVIGLPSFWPDNQLVPLFTSSIGLLIILLYIPGGFVQIGYYTRDSLLRWVEKRMGPIDTTKTSTAPPESLRAASSPLEPARINADGSVLVTDHLTVRFGGTHRGRRRRVPGHARRGHRSHRQQRCGQVDAVERDRWLRPVEGQRAAPRSRRQPVERAPARATRARAHVPGCALYPELTVRDTVQLALEARDPTSFWGSLLWVPSIRPERRKYTESKELIDFLGLGRYADRYVAELSTGTRRIVELATVLAVAPRVICLDEPTAGVAQREAEAFGPLILGSRRSSTPR